MFSSLIVDGLEFQESRVHYTLAGIKSLLKIGEGVPWRKRGGGGVSEPLEPSPGYAPFTRQFTLSCGQGFSPVAYDSFYSTKAITRGHVPIHSFGDEILL